MDSQTYKQILNDDQLNSLLGQELIRDDLLPEILGTEIHQLSSWAGKRLARKYQLADLEAISTFFLQFNLGNLNLTKRTAHKINWTLTGKIVTKRIDAIDDVDFFLEAGIIAQNVTEILETPAESEVMKVNKGKGTVIIETEIGDPKNYQPSEGTPFELDLQNSESE